ncbi:MAG: FG-GAP repeat domain-containing protein [Planctomycetaceae bacterium]
MTGSTLRAAAILAALPALLASAEPHPFEGWQGMRVIPLDGRAERLLVADLGHDGRDDVVVVNPRQARLDVYRWLPPGDRRRDDARDADRPNELPLAPDWAHGEVPIDEMPVDAVAHDVDGDGRPELLVLSTPSNRVSIYAQAAGAAIDAKAAWKKAGDWNLLAGTPAGKSGCLLVRDLPGGGHELLVSCEQGIQQVPLVRGSRAVWLPPRETRSRIDWQLADLDGDGDRDLVEWSSVARQVVRWYPCDGDGRLLPAQTLHDQPIEGLQVGGHPSGAADVYLLGGSDKGVLRRYQLAAGEPTDVGRHDALPLAGAARHGWCGMMVGESAAAVPAIVAVDTAQPRLRMHRLGPEGWLAEESFPSIGGIKALAAPAGAAGTLLVWAKDASDLHRCRWENGRLTYPQPWEREGKDRKIVALDSVGSTVWWAQRVGSDLDLFVWPADQPEPTATRYAGLGPKVEQVVWLGGDTLLVQDAYATAGRFVTLVDGKPDVKTPALLAKVDLSEYLLLDVNGVLRRARLTDGVLQWLGDDLHPVDQVMLTEGQKIAAYLPLPAATGTAGEAWALEQGGGFLHRLAADEAGVMRVAASVKPPAGTNLRWDPVLGLLLVDQDRVVRLSRGRPWELKLLESIDGRVGRRSGVSESTIHRVLATDIDGDHTDDVALCDDRKHQLTALLRRSEGLQRSVTWKVFEDRKYPYDGGESKDMVPEPRRLAGLDADGDGRRDLAMISQDRLVIYLSADDPAAGHEQPEHRTEARP